MENKIKIRDKKAIPVPVCKAVRKVRAQEHNSSIMSEVEWAINSLTDKRNMLLLACFFLKIK